MGDLHDVMVYFQQIFDKPLPGMQDYIKNRLILWKISLITSTLIT